MLTHSCTLCFKNIFDAYTVLFWGWSNDRLVYYGVTTHLLLKCSSQFPWKQQRRYVLLINGSHTNIHDHNVIHSPNCSSAFSLVPRLTPSQGERVWWPLSNFLAVLSQQSWYWTTQWNSTTSCNHVLDQLTNLFVVSCPDPTLASVVLLKSHD